MTESMSHEMPRARQEKLLVHELADEVLVYDLERQKAHCPNKTSALVWNRCDGQADVAEIARLLEQELATSVDESVVWLALKQLVIGVFGGSCLYVRRERDFQTKVVSISLNDGGSDGRISRKFSIASHCVQREHNERKTDVQTHE